MLTPKQTDILRFITDHQADYGQAPSLRQIGTAFAITARAVQQHIDALKRKGVLVDHTPQTARYQLPNTTRSLPLLGSIAAGSPNGSCEQSDAYFEFSPDFFGPHDALFALMVKGDSMSGDGICDGDTAIIRRRATMDDPNAIWAIRIDADEFTLKRIRMTPPTIALCPSNPTLREWSVSEDRIEIIGKLIGLVRRLV